MPTSDPVESIKIQLSTIWGPWARDTPYRQLGWPKQTTLGRVMKEGTDGGRATNKLEPVNPLAEELEGKIHTRCTPRQQRVLRLRYVNGYRIKEIMAKIKRGRTMTHTILDNAHRNLLD